MESIDTTMRQRINDSLNQIETQHNVRILYACESGSRAWGFASEDSDYDVRFLYVPAPEWYFRVDPQRDVIELPIDDVLDINGWEWRKSLGLLKRTNPTLLEWLHSPIIYRESSEEMEKLRTLAPLFFSRERVWWHYFSMAKKNFRGYLQGDMVRLKKYFYVLRPLLAVRWIEADLGIPPVRFTTLLEATLNDGALLSEIDGLLDIKRCTSEAEYSPRRPLLHRFIENELSRHTNRTPLSEPPQHNEQLLDALLYQTAAG